jgi:hypothetical protein
MPRFWGPGAWREFKLERSRIEGSLLSKLARIYVAWGKERSRAARKRWGLELQIEPHLPVSAEMT